MLGVGILAHRGRELLGDWSEQSQAGSVVYMLICIFLVLFAGMMSGLTLGLMSMDIVELEVLRRSGTPQEARQAANIIPVVKNAHFLLVTLLLCNAMAMEALPIFLNKLVDEVVAIVVSVTAVLFMGEVLPQAVCSKHGLVVGSIMSVPVRLLMILTSPISFPIAKLLDYVLGGEHASLFRRKQLKALVTLHAREEGLGGRLTGDEIQIIIGALDLTRKTAYHSMTPLDKVFMLSCDQKLDDSTVSAVMAAKPFSRLPVYRGGNRQDVVGVILVKELLEYVKHFPDSTVSSMKIRQLPRLSADTPMYDLLKLFRVGRSHMALLTQPSDSSTNSSVAAALNDEEAADPLLNQYRHSHGTEPRQLATVHESPRLSRTGDRAAFQVEQEDDRLQASETDRLLSSAGGGLVQSSSGLGKKGGPNKPGLLSNLFESVRTMGAIPSSGDLGQDVQGQEVAQDSPFRSLDAQGQFAVGEPRVRGSSTDQLVSGDSGSMILPWEAGTNIASCSSTCNTRVIDIEGAQQQPHIAMSSSRSQVSLRNLFTRDGGSSGAVDVDTKSTPRRGKTRSKVVLPLAEPPGGVESGTSPPSPQSGLSSAVNKFKTTVGRALTLPKTSDTREGGDSSGSSNRSETGDTDSDRSRLSADLEDMLPVPMLAHPGEAIGIITIEDVIEELMGIEIVDETDKYMDNEQSVPVNSKGLEADLPEHLKNVLMVAERAKHQVMAPSADRQAWLLQAAASVAAGVSTAAHSSGQAATSVLAGLAGSVLRHAFKTGDAQQPGSQPPHHHQHQRNSSIERTTGVGTGMKLGVRTSFELKPGVAGPPGSAGTTGGQAGQPNWLSSVAANLRAGAGDGGFGNSGLNTEGINLMDGLQRSDIHAATLTAAVTQGTANASRPSFANWKLAERLRGSHSAHSNSWTGADAALGQG